MSYKTSQWILFDAYVGIFLNSTDKIDNSGYKRLFDSLESVDSGNSADYGESSNSL
jgi:hypothetical protein